MQSQRNIHWKIYLYLTAMCFLSFHTKQNPKRYMLLIWKLIDLENDMWNAYVEESNFCARFYMPSYVIISLHRSFVHASDG